VSPRDDADSGWRMARAMDEMRAVTIARIQGCNVVGIAGGAEKCQWVLDEFGFDTVEAFETDWATFIKEGDFK